MWFRKRRRQEIVDVINELRELQAVKQASRPQPDKDSIFVLDTDKIINIQTVLKVTELLAKGGMTFVLTGDDLKEYKGIVKKKYE